MSKAVILLNQNCTQNIFCSHFRHYGWQFTHLVHFYNSLQ